MPLCSAQRHDGGDCRAPARTGSDPPLCPHHAGTRAHLSKFTPDTVDRLVQLVSAGNYALTAARAAGISEKTYYLWLRRGAADGPAVDKAYRDFRERIDRALGEGEARNVALIARAATENWQAAAWLLERRHPERWARISQRGEPAQSAPVRDPSDPFAEVDELAERRRRAE